MTFGRSPRPLPQAETIAVSPESIVLLEEAQPASSGAHITSVKILRMSLKLKETVPDESSRFREGKLDRYGLG